MPFCKRKASCHVPFFEKWLLSGQSTIKIWLVECCRDGCPSGSFSHLLRGTLELCQSYHWVLGHLPDQGLSPPIAQFGLVASSRKSLGGSKLVFFVTFNAAELFWYPSPDLCLNTILSRSSKRGSRYHLWGNVCRLLRENIYLIIFLNKAVT